jgi:NADH:ubiquinone oxidoreductase subunit 3 (subunit A)
MLYFLKHFIYIFIAALVIALIGIVAVVVARKNSETRTEEERKERLANCGTCAMSAICMDMGQGPRIECDDRGRIGEN